MRRKILSCFIFAIGNIINFALRPSVFVFMVVNCLTVFFGGGTLRCRYCQNSAISGASHSHLSHRLVSRTVSSRRSGAASPSNSSP